MPHTIEEKGIELLLEHLRRGGHQVERIHGTFDIEVDGKPAEVKTKSKSFDEMDFISLTDNQYKAVQARNFDIFIVCGVADGVPGGQKPEFYKVQACALRSKQHRVVISYEYGRNTLRDALERLP